MTSIYKEKITQGYTDRSSEKINLKIGEMSISFLSLFDVILLDING